MKVGRREFLKMVGAAAGTVVAPKQVEGIEKQTLKVAGGDTYYPQWYTPSWLVDATHDLVEDLHEAEFREAEQYPLPTEPDYYDCYFYMPIAQGSLCKSWIEPRTGMTYYTQLEWYDHGLHTYFMANEHYLGTILSNRIDPCDYLHSIWTAGLIAAGIILRR